MPTNTGQEISVRLMHLQEAKKVQQLGRRAFMGLESLFVSKPKDAVVALDGDLRLNSHFRTENARQYERANTKIENGSERKEWIGLDV